MNDLQVIQTSEMLQAINRSEIDIQITTAKTYPRELSKVLNTIRTYATMDSETAEDCFYALRRGQGDDTKIIEGISVRLSEIFAGAWGNLRVQTRIIGNDGKKITAQGVCHDLETNLAVSVEVHRKITDKYGRTFSEDMQVVTGNAASAIAFRNAVLKVIPKAITKKIVEEIKLVALGNSIDLETRRQRAIAHFQKIGVTDKMLFEHLEVKTIAEIDAAKVMYLSSLSNAIKEGTTSVEETFIKPAQEKAMAQKAMEEAKAAESKVAEAMQSGKVVEKPVEPAGKKEKPKKEK